jgi:predicted ATPase/DNA-binding SARP family transcriptional activator
VTVGVCRFGVLGPLVLERDGVTVPLPSGRQRTLLALLALGGGVAISRDRLIDELWGEHPPASAVSALHVHLSKLRGLLGGALVLEAAGYALTRDAYELDLWRFEALIERARSEPQGAAALLTEALALFRGEPLCDVASEGAVADWRRTLEEKRLQAVLMRLDAELAAGGAGELVAELERLVGAHPFEERLWGQLMVALHRAGRQAEALEAYQRARRLFAGELGLEPGAPLARLQQRVLDRDPALLAADDAAGSTGVSPGSGPGSAAPGGPRDARDPASPASNLPRPLTRLLGREDDLASLTELTDDPDLRLVTLTGPGGVGKTRLVLELARRLEHDYADGAVFVRLEKLTDPALVAAEIASALAVRDGTDGPSADGLPGYLRDRELLMVIDNFEHLLAAASLVAELLETGPRIRLLVSSRTALRIRGEQTFEVEPLGLPAGESDAELAGSPAVQLFLQCATAADRRLEIDPATTRTMATICRALDGLPLAIELAASRSHLMSPAQIADQLAQPLSIGEHALRDLPDRQQTLQSTIRWSYDLLTPGARETLCSAGVFLGGFTLPALEVVVGRPVAAEADELLESRLIRRQLAEGRFELLELVRAFALEELEAGGRAATAHEHHREYFARHAAPAREAFDQGGAPGELAAPLLVDHANLRAAFEDALQAGDERTALDVALGLRPLWLAGMLRQESQEIAGRLLDRFSIAGEHQVPLLRAVAYLDYSPTAKSWHRRLAACAAEIGDQEALTTATGNLFGQALNAQDRAEMRRLRPELQGLLTPDASPRATGWIQYFLALDAYVDGRLEAACEYAELSLQRGEEIEHEVMIASAAGTLLLARSARDGTIPHDALSDTLERMRRPSVQPLSAFGLWLVARYAVTFDPAAAGGWLAQAERIVEAIDSQLWPECALRDETLAALEVFDVHPLLDATPPLDHAAALAQAAEWLAGRDPAESAPRAGALLFSAA